MTPSARLQATIEILDEIDRVPRPADALVSGYFRARRYIGSKDRAAIAEMTYDILRHHGRLMWWLERYICENTPRLRLVAYLALVQGTKAEIINEMFSGGKFAPASLNDGEKKALKKLAGHTLEHPEMPEAVVVECPDWAAPMLQKRFGKKFGKEMAAMLDPAPLDLRVNTSKATREEVIRILRDGGFKAVACKYSPFGVRLWNRPSLGQLTLLKEGKVEIQDEGSQLVAMLVDAKPGHRVVDFCAGAGGKSLAMAAMMENKGRIIACDVFPNRLKRSAERFRRAGVHNIEVKPLANENDPWVKKHKESFDRVLVDAPCSGTGTWRRNPDQRWRSLGQGLESLIPLQTNILKSAARLVKPGGRLIYATCSLLPRENEEQIEKFLAAHEDFRAVPVNKICPDIPANGPFMALTPATHGTDGFFAAVVERKIK